MHYSQELNVPANTLLAGAVSGTIDIAPGQLQHISLIFPPGCARMVRAAIYDGATLLFPKTAGSSYCEDAYTIEIDCAEIYDATKTLTLKAWAPGTTYAHKLTAHYQHKSIEEIAMGRTGYY